MAAGGARCPADPALLEWLDNEPAESIWTTAITVFEVRTGISLLERGRRRTQLERSFVQILDEDLDGRVQVFDQAAARIGDRVA